MLSPWDVAWWPALGRLVVAAAGVHLLLSVDPATGATAVLAGTTVEGLRDGPALDGWLAQPSGLAVDGDRLWFVDSETSALRYLTIDGELHTAVGEGLFDFGHVDGPAQQARFQHPLGVTLLADGSVAVLDTYNGAVRRYDPATDAVSTLATRPARAVRRGAGRRRPRRRRVGRAPARPARPALGTGQRRTRSTPPVPCRRSRPAPSRSACGSRRHRDASWTSGTGRPPG